MDITRPEVSSQFLLVLWVLSVLSSGSQMHFQSYSGQITDLAFAEHSASLPLKTIWLLSQYVRGTHLHCEAMNIILVHVGLCLICP